MEYVSALDVAAYILKKMGPMSTMKLQKLVYYSQAWSLVWDDAPMFTEDIEAWVHGPVVKKLYVMHRGEFSVGAIPGGDPAKLGDDAKETIDMVLEYYGKFSGGDLSAMTHSEKPWIDARLGCDPNEASGSVISLASMAEYYSSLQ